MIDSFQERFGRHHEPAPTSEASGALASSASDILGQVLVPDVVELVVELNGIHLRDDGAAMVILTCSSSCWATGRGQEPVERLDRWSTTPRMPIGLLVLIPSRIH